MSHVSMQTMHIVLEDYAKALEFIEDNKQHGWRLNSITQCSNGWEVRMLRNEQWN